MRSPLRFLTDNWQLKLLALALAVLLWVVVSAEQVTSQWIPVPLRVEEHDPNYELIPTPLAEEVNVRFTGSGRDLMELAIRKPPLVLSIDQVQGSAQDFRLDPSMVQIPSQLTVNAQEVRAPLVRLTFRRLSSRTIPIQPVVDEEMQSGWTLVDTLRLTPRQVEVRGPAERVETIQFVRTVPFNLPASDSSFSTTVEIDTADLAGLELNVREVQVSGQVDQVVQRRLVDVGISVGPGVLVRPNVVDVLLSGPRGLVERMQPSSFRVVVSIAEVPEFIPQVGISVPLRVEQLRPGVSATILPPAVRLLPVGAPTDTGTTAEPSEPPANDGSSTGPVDDG